MSRKIYKSIYTSCDKFLPTAADGSEPERQSQIKIRVAQIFVHNFCVIQC
jgi:hypothetical protein